MAMSYSHTPITYSALLGVGVLVLLNLQVKPHKNMRSSLISSPIPPFLFLLIPKRLCSQSQFLTDSISESSLPQNFNQNFYSANSHEPKIPENHSPGSQYLGNSTFPKSKRVEFSATTSHLEGTVLTRPRVIDTLLSFKSDPKTALAYYNQLERKRGFVRRLDSLCVLLHILTRSSEIAPQAQYFLHRFISGHSGPMPSILVDHLFESAKRFNFESDSRVYNCLLKSYVSANKLNHALHSFNRMIELDIVPCVPFFNLVLTALVNNNMISETQNVYNKMVLKGVRGDCFTVLTMMRASLKEGKGEEVKKYLSELNALTDRLCVEGDMGTLLAVYREMCESGVLLNVVTYTALIHACCKSNNIDFALKIQNEMKNKGLELDVTACGALIDGFCKKGDMGTANQLLGELLQAGLSPNSVVYCSMISGYKKLNNMEAALHLHKRMLSEGIPCTLQTYTILIDGLLKEGALLFASDLYSEMLAKGIMPDISTCTVLIEGACSKGQAENALKILEEMDRKGMTPNVFIYCTVIGWHFRAGNLQEAFRLRSEMLEKGVVPDDTTFDILVNRKVRDGNSLFYERVPSFEPLNYICKRTLRL